MKALIALAVLLALGATAQAKTVPVERQPVATSHNDNDSAMYIGPAGALLESDYFRAPQPPLAAGRVFPCRLQLLVFEKTRLAQSCN